MIKNNPLLLIFPKKARLISILSIIVVYLLTIVSKNTFAYNYSVLGNKPINTALAENEPIYPLFEDDFEDGNLSGWKQTNDWEVSSTEKIADVFSLKHLSKTIGTFSSIFHTLNVDCNSFDIEWSFKIKNGKWDPSTDNRFWFYLSADTIQTGLINGWAVGVNLKGSSDLLELWRIRNGKPDSLIIQSDMDWNNSTLATINVKRSSQGSWQLVYTKQGEPISNTFIGTDPAIANFKNIGVCFNFTSSRAGLLWIDDILVNLKPAEIFIQKLRVVNSHTLIMTFSKPIDPSSLQINNFMLTDESNLTIPILKITPGQESNQVVEIQLGKVSGVLLNLGVSGVCDLSGLAMIPTVIPFSFSFIPEVGSVLINEILFNPLTGGTDFVELVNVSEVPISIDHLKLASRNDTLALKQIFAVSSSIGFLKPGHYLTCTKNPQFVIPFYISNDPETFCAMKSFPTYPDDAGIVVLLNDSLEVMDEFSYTAKMHSPLLANDNGVSLERISLDQPTAHRSNWTSATTSSGFATPGLPNSQAIIRTETIDDIITEQVVFSPNGDGANDYLTIRFSLGKPGYTANVRIFDIVGRQVKFLVKNESLAQEGTWTWNGDSDTSQRLNMGVYILLVELFDRDGRTKTFKKTCTLTDRMK